MVKQELGVKEVVKIDEAKGKVLDTMDTMKKAII